MVLGLFDDKKRIPAGCKIEFAGSEIEDMYPALMSVNVVSSRANPTEATIIIETRRIEDGAWSVQDDDRFKPWVEVRISAVFGDEEEEVMSGYVRVVRAEYPAEKGSAKVSIICQDHSLALNRVQRNYIWGEDVPITDRTIASEIAGRNPINLSSVPGEGQTVEELLQNNTDLQFMLDRARANGYELIFNEGTMYFGPMRLDGDAQETILVYAGNDTNCISFNIQDDGHMPDKIAYEVAAETGSESSPQEVTPDLRSLGNNEIDSSQSGLDDFVWRPQREGVSDETQMQAQAQQMANEQSMKIQVDGELDGTMYGHVLLVANLVGVDGVGERYSGTYYVDSATHQFDINGYRTTFKLIRNAYGDDLSESNSLLAGIL